MHKITVGIIGCGFVGGALKRWLEEHNSGNVKLLVSDPPKGLNDNIETADIIFISVHLPTEDDSSQDLTLLKQIIKGLPDKPIFIRTTILPGTADKLSKEFKKHIYFMPEFLSERTAYQNFCSQTMVFTGEIELLKKIFPKKKFIEMTSLEAEIAKYSHNVFGALKVTYFNGIFDICDKLKISYQKVLEGVLASEYINSVHTQVPGPDGKFGYGGKCFPKDVNAFIKQFKDYPINDLLKPLNPLNNKFRKDGK
jgi:UDP-glucose 6-dehydrogenase